jgi:hypothetical protein
VKKLVLATVLLALPALAADKPNDNKPLSQEIQIKVLKAERQIQQIQLQMSNLQRQ